MLKEHMAQVTLPAADPDHARRHGEMVR